jgi:hypothetical protein
MIGPPIWIAIFGFAVHQILSGLLPKQQRDREAEAGNAQQEEGELSEYQGDYLPPKMLLIPGM